MRRVVGARPTLSLTRVGVRTPVCVIHELPTHSDSLRFSVWTLCSLVFSVCELFGHLFFTRSLVQLNRNWIVSSVSWWGTPKRR